MLINANITYVIVILSLKLQVMEVVRSNCDKSQKYRELKICK